MNYEQITEFLSLPELPDIIAYLLYIVVVISIYFVKAYVKRDNNNTLFQVNDKTKKLDDAINKFEKKAQELENERKKIAKEFKSIKEAIKQEANNSHELVANGTANEIARMLDKETQSMEEEDGER